MILENVRFSYLTVFEPKPNQSGDLRFSTAILLEAGHPQLEELQAEINKAAAKGVEKGDYTKEQTKSKRFKGCIRDGSEEHATEERGKEYDGHFFFNASNSSQPGIVDDNVRPIVDPSSFWSGCYGNADVGFYPFNKGGGIGVGAALNNIMMTREGERLDGRQSADEAFDAFKSQAPTESME